MNRRLLSLLAPALLAVTLTPVASAQYAATGKTTWNFDETTTGANVSWVSPTAVDPSASGFNTSYTLDVVEVGWAFSFFTGTLDVTDQIPPEQAAGSGEAPGPAPIALFDLAIVYPDTGPVAVAATVGLGLDATGKGFFTATDVVLGTTQVEVPLFGLVTVDITSIRVAGSLTMHATWFDLGAGLAGSLGEPLLSGTGSLEAGSAGALTLVNALPLSTAYLIMSLSELSAPFKGGTLVPFPDLFTALPVDAGGAVTVPFVWPAAIPARVPLFLQYWVVDAAGPKGFAASNALKGVTP